jgi:hypothetical protein
MRIGNDKPDRAVPWRHFPKEVPQYRNYSSKYRSGSNFPYSSLSRIVSQSHLARLDRENAKSGQYSQNGCIVIVGSSIWMYCCSWDISLIPRRYRLLYDTKIRPWLYDSQPRLLGWKNSMNVVYFNMYRTTNQSLSIDGFRS